MCWGERDGFRKRGGSPSRGSVGWLKEAKRGGKGAARERFGAEGC